MKSIIYQLIKFGNGEYGIKKIETFNTIFFNNTKEFYLNFSEYMNISCSTEKLWFENREDSSFWKKCQESYKNVLRAYNDICSANDEILKTSS